MDTVHRIYTGIEMHGGHGKPFGKCLCGAVLHGQEEIDDHEKKISEEA